MSGVPCSNQRTAIAIPRANQPPRVVLHLGVVQAHEREGLGSIFGALSCLHPISRCYISDSQVGVASSPCDRCLPGCTNLSQTGKSCDKHRTDKPPGNRGRRQEQDGYRTPLWKMLAPRQSLWALVGRRWLGERHFPASTGAAASNRSVQQWRTASAKPCDGPPANPPPGDGGGEP